jgi:hypothetical protein
MLSTLPLIALLFTLKFTFLCFFLLLLFLITLGRGVVLFSRHRLKPSVEQAAEDNLLNIYTRAEHKKREYKQQSFLLPYNRRPPD